MRAAIQRLCHRISHWAFSGFPRREPGLDGPETADEIAFRFKDCEECGPSAEDLEAKDRERAERFKRDQLLPIMGWSTGVPG
ncbi:hypothetical protein [Microvirga sp. VF16]|uniref:hypothetical protein n=1 Tax=Microvirga sp. VF16 TaxID=2807101 RepID=UPI00193D5B81|nr:hypothetical protein [Microvirga sp. VF16]QRM36123.1 hypothetical protein JO965_46070 [Microvirga sp. VF16]